MPATNAPVARILFGLSLLAACRGDSNSNGNPDAPGGADADDGQIDVRDVQSEAMAVNTQVELHGVIVTAVDVFGRRQRAFWVQDPGGGERSGVQVFVADTAVLGLAVGDVVDISGAIKTEFALSGDDADRTGRTVTELAAPRGSAITVTKTGKATPPAPHVLDVAALDAMSMAARDAEYEKWEGVLIEVRNVRTRTYPFGFGSERPIPEDSYKVNVTDTLVVESTQTKFGDIDGLTCFASITGVQDYFYDWLLLPRSADDLVVGTGCAAVSAPAADIAGIQATTPTGTVELKDVYVTGVSANRVSVWLSTSPTAEKGQGAVVFHSTTALALPTAVVTGAKVTVTGTVSEFNDDEMGEPLTQVRPLRITVADEAIVTPVPIEDVTVVELKADAAAYESVLVTLENVRITTLGTAANGFIARAVQNEGDDDEIEFGIGTEIKDLKDADLACYRTVSGFWTSLLAPSSTATTKPNDYGFIVRDLGTPDTCE